MTGARCDYCRGVIAHWQISVCEDGRVFHADGCHAAWRDERRVTRGENYRLIVVAFTGLRSFEQVVLSAERGALDLMRDADLVILAAPGQPGLVVKDRLERESGDQAVLWSEVVRLMRSRTARVIEL